MLIRIRDQQAIARGEVDLVFRRWKRPTVVTGGTLRTTVGVLAIDSVEPVEESKISSDDAKRAGFDSRQALIETLRQHPEGNIYRIALRLAGPDPREALRAQDDLTEDDILEIDRRLTRFDQASPQSPWTAETLRLIAEKPATRAAELAASLGFETRWFKTKVRKLKELGLTESLGTGYRLSARGRAYCGLKGSR